MLESGDNRVGQCCWSDPMRPLCPALISHSLRQNVTPDFSLTPKPGLELISLKPQGEHSVATKRNKD